MLYICRDYTNSLQHVHYDQLSSFVGCAYFWPLGGSSQSNHRPMTRVFQRKPEKKKKCKQEVLLIVPEKSVFRYGSQTSLF